MADPTDDRRHAPATLRNRGPILTVLERALPRRGRVVEVASGTGEHAAWLAPRLAPLVWQPSDADPGMLASIAAHAAAANAPNLRPPLRLDVAAPGWWKAIEAAAAEDAGVTGIVAINMLHIAPWRAAEGLLAGAERLLPPGAVLYLYGPFSIAGKHTAASNAAFDRMLRERDPAWGVRDLEAVASLAGRHGFAPPERVAMPANNLSLIFRRLDGGPKPRLSSD